MSGMVEVRDSSQGDVEIVRDIESSRYGSFFSLGNERGLNEGSPFIYKEQKN